MGRPKKADKQQTRDRMVRIRVSAGEKEKLKRLAKESGYNPSNYIRLKTIDSQPTQAPLLPERELLIHYQAELGKIGSNVNQIARAINRREKTGEKIGIGAELIRTAMQSIDELTTRLLTLLGHGDYRRSAR